MTDAGKATKRKTASRKTATRAKPADRRRPSRAAKTEERVSVPVPVLTPHMKVLNMPVPGMSYVSDAGRVVAGYLPPPERLAFYGGLGLAAIVGVLDWPVATAIGIGAMIARRGTQRRDAPGGGSR